MTLIQLHIPEELLKNVHQAAPHGVESFVITAIEHELSRWQNVTDSDIEIAAATDQGHDFLTDNELNYYLRLPDYV